MCVKARREGPFYWIIYIALLSSVYFAWQTVAFLICGFTKMEEKKEILYDGSMYDVTAFISKHPGGDVIEYYTAKGEDATIPILQFHNRSMKHVNLLLKSLKKRPATLEDYDLNEEKKRLHDEMTTEYMKLFREVEAEGLFKPNYLYNTIVVIEILTWLIAGAYFIRNYDSYFVKGIGIFMVGLGMGRSGLLQHEGGHNSITTKPKIDKFLQNIFFGLFMSMSAKWWVQKHARHHAMPQRIGHDMDMELMPLLAAYEECITDPKSIWQNNWFLRNQFFVLMPLTLITYIPIASFVLSPLWILQHGFLDEVIALIIHYAIAIPSIGFVPYVLAKIVMGWYLLNNFSLNHTHLPTANEPCHWIEYCTKHTANCTNNFFNDWFTILLNYQIEHHLFPTMPQSNLRHVVSRSKVLAAKFNLPYRVFTLFEAEMEIMKHIYKVMIHIRNVCKKSF